MASVFVLHGESSEEDKDIYTYACEAVISTTINILISLIISLLFGLILQGVVFVSVFAFLRRFTGGHHASTHMGCILTFNAVLILALLFYIVVTSSMYFENIFLLLISTISLIGILIFTPVSHDNKPINDILRQSAKKKSRILIIVLWVFCIFDSFVFNTGMGLSIALAMFSVFASLVYAVTINKFTKEGRGIV